MVFEVEGSGTRMILTGGPYPEDVHGNAAAGWDNPVANLDALLS